jgi:hypothetical protein
MMIYEKLMEYYAGLLIMQYNGRQNATETIRQLVRIAVGDGISYKVIDAYGMIDVIGDQNALLDEIDELEKSEKISHAESKRAAVRGMYTFQHASGHQLDIVAKFIGIGRVYFKYGTAHALSDEDFRTLLRLKAINNNSNHSISDMVTAIWDTFRDGLIPFVSGIMSMMYFLDEEMFNRQILDAAVWHNSLPRHLAVKLNGYIAKKDAPYFSLLSYDEEFGIIPLLVISRNGDFMSVTNDDDLLICDEIVDESSSIAYKLRTGFTDYDLWAEKPGYFLNGLDMRQF